jgi:hypothetical protein
MFEDNFMFRFKCGNCDAWHEGAPSLACQVPDPLLTVPPHERRARVFISSETAVLDKTRYFVRACMEVPINGTEDSFIWGLWAEVKQEDFLDYCATSEKGTVGGPYRGSLANSLPFYADCFGIPVSVEPRPGDQRPLLQTPDGDSGLARHLKGGMPEQDARAYFERILHPGAAH